MAADHRAASLLHFGVPALEDSLQYLEALSFIRESHDGERGDGSATHGVNVAQRIGRRDLAEGVGIVHNGRKEIHGLNQCQVRAELIHSSVVIGVEAHQHIWGGLFRQLGQHAVQNTWTQLGRSTRRFDHHGQTNWRHNQNSCGRGDSSCANPQKQPRHAQEWNHHRKYSRAHPVTAGLCGTAVGVIWDAIPFETPVIPAKAGIQSFDRPASFFSRAKTLRVM